MSTITRARQAHSNRKSKAADHRQVSSSILRTRSFSLILLALAAAVSAPLASASAATLNLPLTPITASQNLVAPNSFFATTLSGVGAGFDITNATYLGWCGDSQFAPVVPTQAVTAYSTYSATLPANAANAAWPKVNHVLNNKIGTPDEIQAAIWLLLTGTTTYDVTANVTAMLNAANANPGFVPAAGQKVAVLLYIDGFAPAGPVQDTIIEVVVPGTPGDLCTGVIGDVVWQDTNRDGIQDAGEPGINGVTVRLKNSVGTVIKTTVTATVGTQQGIYNFTKVCAGTYTVEVDTATLPAGLTPTLNGVGADRAVDSNGSPAIAILSTDASSDLTIDFGYQSPCTGMIGDFVWSDTNGNGIQDSGEPGINGVKVNLYDASGVTLLGTTTTSSSGFYQFTGKCRGSYTVKVDASTLPPNLTQTATGAGLDPTKDSNGSPVLVVLNLDNSVDNTVDFGYKSACAGTIGDFVWHDQNGNGIQDLGEPGLNGVTVRLKNSSGAVIATAVTAANAGLSGYYLFSGVCAGAYTVEVDTATVPAGFSPTTANAPGSNTNNDSNSSPSAVTLSTNTSVVTNIDFGYLSPCTGEIGDYVWYDINVNGQQDAGEPGILGVTINLRDPGTNALIATTTTDADGFYEFTGRCAGSYKVEVVTPSGYAPTTEDAAGVPDTIDSDGSPVNVSLTTNSSVNNTIDFGFKLNVVGACPLTIGYWKNHANKWGASSLTLGSQTYTKTELLALFKLPVSGDASINLAHQLIAAKLNLLNGAVGTPISASITAADALLAGQSGKLPYKIHPSTALGAQMVARAAELDNFNRGKLTNGCAH